MLLQVLSMFIKPLTESVATNFVDAMMSRRLAASSASNPSPAAPAIPTAPSPPPPSAPAAPAVTSAAGQGPTVDLGAALAAAAKLSDLVAAKEAEGKPYVGPVHFFVSHAWAYRWGGDRRQGAGTWCLSASCACLLGWHITSTCSCLRPTWCTESSPHVMAGEWWE